MTDNFLTKDDLQVFLTAFQQDWDKKSQAREAEFKKELDIQANKIHSSYAKKNKQAEVDDDEEPEKPGTPHRKPTKRELEMQDNIEKLLKRSEESEARAAEAEAKAGRAALRNNISELMIKNGINPEAIDTVHALLEAKQSLADGKWKVNVDGAEVALEPTKAVQYFVKSPDAKFFLVPKGINGSGAKTSQRNKVADVKGTDKHKVDVDWTSIGRDLITKNV